MSKFGHLKELEVTAESTAEFPMHWITVNGKSPTLILKAATEANKPYFNALLKHSGKSRQQLKAGNVNAGLIEENRDQDRDLYPRFVIQGWLDMIDGDSGKDVKFSQKECGDFLDELPDWLFDNVREFAGSPTNFTDVMDLQVNAGNSQSGSSSS